jgi:hypothetical protein
MKVTFKEAPKGDTFNKHLALCYLHGGIILEVGLSESDEGQTYVNFAKRKSDKMNEKTGKNVWVPTVRFEDDEIRDSFRKIVVDAYGEWKKTQAELKQSDTDDDKIPF